MDYSAGQLVWIAFSLLLIAMSKGGLPIGTVAIPVLILVWPNSTNAAREAVAFMLPMLCVMDLAAVLLYRRRIRWDLLRPLFPGMLLGVLIGTIGFVSREKSLLSVSDRALKFAVGLLGVLFVLYHLLRSWIVKSLTSHHPRAWEAWAFGTTAGVTSTLAHAAMPVMQMYLLPRRLPKKQFAASVAAFFWVLNLVKVPPFIWGGRFNSDLLVLNAVMLPVIPLGVLLGYWLVHVTKPRWYTAFIYVALAGTSVLLIVKSLRG